MCISASDQRKKSKKKVKQTALPAVSTGSLHVDSGFLCCAHHEVMIAGLTMLGVGAQQNIGRSVCVCVCVCVCVYVSQQLIPLWGDGFLSKFLKLNSDQTEIQIVFL